MRTHTFILLVLGSLLTVSDAVAAPYPPSTLIEDVQIFWGTHVQLANDSDNHAVTWSNDGKQYVTWGDGFGFEFDGSKRSLGISRLSGTKNNPVGEDVYYGFPKPPACSETPIDSLCNGLIDGKSYGIISISGTLYMWVNPRSGIKGYLSQRLYFSDNKGADWDRVVDWDFPKSDKITNLTFAQFGRNYSDAPNNYVYIYAVSVKDDSQELKIQKPGEIVLMRVLKDKLEIEDAYRFFAGMDGSSPTWSPDIEDMVPVFEDANGVGWTVSVSYNEGLNRYILITEFDDTGVDSGQGKVGIHESPKPWGPWRTALYTDFDNVADKAFFWNFSSKWTNGRDFTLIFTGTGALDSFNLVRGHFD